MSEHGELSIYRMLSELKNIVTLIYALQKYIQRCFYLQSTNIAIKGNQMISTQNKKKLVN